MNLCKKECGKISDNPPLQSNSFEEDKGQIIASVSESGSKIDFRTCVSYHVEEPYRPVLIYLIVINDLSMFNLTDNDTWTFL